MVDENHGIDIREIEVSDAERFLTLSNKLDGETKFMMFEQGERLTTLEEQRDIIKQVILKSNDIIFVADDNGDLVGYIGAYGGEFKRNLHSIYIVIGIRYEYTGKGIGTSLFGKLDEWACKHKIHRLELTAISNNLSAIALYKKMGFEIEGIKKHSLCVDSSYVDEYYMAKLI